MRYYLIILLSSTIVCSTDMDVVQGDNVKIVKAGEDVNLTCTFSSLLQLTTAWFKQTAGGKSLQIVSSYLKQKPIWKNNSENRFNVVRGDGNFNLTILTTKPSDSAIYFCVISEAYTNGMGTGTRLLVRDSAANRTLQQSLIDTVHPGASVNLQCSIFTESCGGDHSVFWFKQSSGDSEGLLYTKAERNGLCKNSVESQTLSCIFNLTKNNISHSDSGIYYCAVAACGEILFGNGTKIYIKESSEVSPSLLASGILNIIFLALVFFWGFKRFRGQNNVTEAQEIPNEDSLNYAAITFNKKPPKTRRAKANVIEEQSLYAQVRSHQ